MSPHFTVLTPASPAPACAFCEAPVNDVRALVQGARVAICDHCAEVAARLIATAVKPGRSPAAINHLAQELFRPPGVDPGAAPRG